MTATNGKLYIVATPIGNLGDFTFRAVEMLRQVEVIAAEDTRQTRNLLQRYAVRTKLVAFHEHNEHRLVQDLIERMLAGSSIALVSDAGTPLINDPGFELVGAAIEKGLPVVPVPGPSALIAALTVSGLATNRFGFYGFPPRNRAARKALFESLIEQTGTLIFFEACHRIIDCVIDCAEAFPAERKLVIARELTKSHETVVRTRVGDAVSLLKDDVNVQKGELVLLIQGASAKTQRDVLLPEHIRMLKILLEECSVRKTAELVSKITGVRKKLLYSAALEIERSGRDRGD
ncbi:MAG: 16S rRNA (cytidine(1402)-2'-O)-methyltransferase [Methylococcaceae bacterium]|nr:16S rRNA (cytidine(1402)-2'-O)-methyltransferase [Methylococcaceae bacterium]MCI0733574.1 16S rRNA (cytidine(1402)-2'-O)-methyltransferase [Methylococcaceae bacterium]